MDALAALDQDGDLYLPIDMELPRACDELGAEQALDEAGLLAGDCDDEDEDRHPNQEEICGDGKDQDCDGEDAVVATVWVDADLDGYGDPAFSQESCGAVEGYVDNDLDCDDLDATVNPEAEEEACGDTVDQDCDGVTDCPLSGDIDLSADDWSELGALVATSPAGGIALAAGLDVDGDGVADALVGGDGLAWTLTVGADRTPVAFAVELESVEGEGTGATVALLPDLDGDGLAELAVGSPGWDEAAEDAGRAFLRYSASPEEPAQVVGEGREDYAGLVLGAAGGGLAIGQYTGDSWRVYVLGPEEVPAPGVALPLDSGSDLTRITGLAGSEEAPPVMTAQSKDLWSDVVVGQPGYSSGRGRAQIFYAVGPASGVVDAAGITVTTSSTAALGASVAILDIDTDGVPDLATGAPEEKAVYVFTRPEEALEDEEDGALSVIHADYVFSGATSTGAALAAAADLNGDGANDLLVGAPDADTAYVLLGGALLPADAGVIRASAVLAAGEGSRLGAAVAAADVDGDGHSDALLGAPGMDGVYVLWGGP